MNTLLGEIRVVNSSAHWTNCVTRRQCRVDQPVFLLSFEDSVVAETNQLIAGNLVHFLSSFDALKHCRPTGNERRAIRVGLHLQSLSASASDQSKLLARIATANALRLKATA